MLNDFLATFKAQMMLERYRDVIHGLLQCRLGHLHTMLIECEMEWAFCRVCVKNIAISQGMDTARLVLVLVSLKFDE